MAKDQLLDDIDPELNFYNEINVSNKYYEEDLFHDIFKNDRGLSVIHFNVRSLRANFDKLCQCLDNLNYKFDVIAITETWMNNDTIVSDYEIDEYDLYYVNRVNKRGGGVGIYVKNELNCKQLKQYSVTYNDIMECITIELSFSKKKNVIISCVYRTPGSCVHAFCEQIELLFSNITARNKKVVICGDFNIDLLQYDKQACINDFVDLMYSLGLTPVVNKPTRITEHSSTLIDNIFLNEVVNSNTSGVLIADVSDHLPIFTIINGENVQRKVDHNVKSKHIRVINENTITSLKADLCKENWKNVYEAGDVNQAYEYFLYTFNSLFDKHCTATKTEDKCYSENNDGEKMWITKGVKNACLKKNKLYKEFLKSRTPESHQRYKRYRNKLNDVIRQCKREYYESLLSRQQNNVKGTWKILNEIIRKKGNVSNIPESFVDSKDGHVINDKKEICDTFNKFFTNIGPDLASKIPVHKNMSVYQYMDKPNDNAMFLEPVTEQEILKIVCNLKSKMSTDFNGISMLLIKNVVHEIVKPFTYICNKSLNEAVFPDAMKIAKILPIFKAGNKEEFTNYRPVSLLPQFSKVLEKIFDARLSKFISKHDILCDSQYGFRQNRSTASALLELIENITSNTDKKCVTLGVFIDLKKAFDTIDHTLLIQKLEFYGLHGKASNWINSYLTNRKQYVQYDDVTYSNISDVICGVPQGSILGPKLFILYINDMCNVSKLLNFTIFADDTNVFCSGTDIKKLCENMSNELDKLALWFDVNKLSLNVSKTNFMVFGNKRNLKNICVTINSITIDRVYETKFLGVYIDEHLNWKCHIKYLQTKLSRCIGILYKASFVISKLYLRKLYCALFLPYIMYCCEIWGNTYKTNLNCIVVLQKKIIRIISKKKLNEHTTELFHDLKLLKFTDVVELKTAVTMYLAHNNSLPSKIQQLFVFVNNDQRHYETRQVKIFKDITPRTTKKEMCLSVRGINLWNKMNAEFINVCKLNIFKRKYKLMLLKKYNVNDL